jgi:hypothetical protein
MVYEHEEDYIRCGHRRHNRPLRRAMVGGLLVLVGGAMLLGSMGYVTVLPIWNQWPLLFVLFGMVRLVEAEYLGDYVSGAVRIGFGAWLYACVNHFGGLTFQTSWPFVAILVGAGMVVRALPGMYRRSGKEE